MNEIMRKYAFKHCDCIREFIGDMEKDLSIEELQWFWAHKFTAHKRTILSILGDELNNYPKCKSVFILEDKK